MRNYLILAVAAVLVAFILRDAVIQRNRTDKTISVTGSGKKDFTSDLIVWSGSFSKTNFNLKEAYAQLDRDRELLRNYLVSQGIPAASVVFSSVNINRD